MIRIDNIFNCHRSRKASSDRIIIIQKNNRLLEKIKINQYHKSKYNISRKNNKTISHKEILVSASGKVKIDGLDSCLTLVDQDFIVFE